MMFLAIYRKTLGDLSNPKAIVAYLLAFGGVLFFMTLGFVNNEIPDSVGSLPLAEQELALLTAYAPLVWLLGVGLGLLTAGSLFVALTLATEAERGTLDLLLSKPVRRWEVLLAVFLANVSFLFVVGVAGLLLVALALYQMGGFSAAALGGGVFEWLPAVLAYTLFVCTLVNAVGMAASVATRNRLQTAALTALIPVLFFVLFVVRVFPGDIYEGYYLYLLDMSYHLGNVYTLFLGAFGESIPVETQARLGFWTGVYDVPEDVSTVAGSLELIGYIDPIGSLLFCLALTIGSLAFAVVKFQRLDV